MSRLLDFLTTQRAEFRQARLPSLYSDFRGQRTTNPDGYEVNIATWESGLAAAAKAGVLLDGSLTIQCGSQLERDLQTRECGLPQALGAVIEESVLKGRMIPFSNFLSSSKSIYDRTWDLTISQVPLKLASWVLQQAGLISKAAKDPGQRYVLVTNLEDAATAVSKTIAARSRRVDRAVPLSEFRQEAANALKLDALNDTDFKVLLTFLRRDKQLIAYNDEAVKIKAATESIPVLTTEDVNICSLKSLMTDLNERISSINARIEQLQAKAKDAILKKNKTSALSALRSKKVQEELLTKRSDTLGQLESVFARIEEAADQVEIVKAMEGSTKVLRSLTSEIGGVDTVEDVLRNLHEEMDKVDEVSTLIGEEGSLAAGVDETAIDDELEQMEADAKAEEKRKEAEATRERLQALDVAKVPTTIPESTQEKTEERRVAELG